MEYEFHLNVLSDGQKRLADVFSREAWLGSFYLAGGTSLALQLGHRQSIDFDFFTKDPMPVMLRTVSWDDVKDDMRKKIKNMKW
jgi:hypothetical protein